MSDEPGDASPPDESGAPDAGGAVGTAVAGDDPGIVPTRPHGPAVALALLATSVVLAGALGWLAPHGGTFPTSLLPALLVMAWIGPAYGVAARQGADPFVVHALWGRPRRLGLATAITAAILLAYVIVRRALSADLPSDLPDAAAWVELGGRLPAGLLFVALPEEYLFRGVLQPSLEREGGARWRVLGAPLGRGAVLAAALFALCHLLLPAPTADLRRLAVFFPALWFAWLRAATGSVAPAVVAHALANFAQEACNRLGW